MLLGGKKQVLPCLSWRNELFIYKFCSDLKLAKMAVSECLLWEFSEIKRANISFEHTKTWKSSRCSAIHGLKVLSQSNSDRWKHSGRRQKSWLKNWSVASPTEVVKIEGASRQKGRRQKRLHGSGALPGKNRCHGSPSLVNELSSNYILEQTKFPLLNILFVLER